MLRSGSKTMDTNVLKGINPLGLYGPEIINTFLHLMVQKAVILLAFILRLIHRNCLILTREISLILRERPVLVCRLPQMSSTIESTYDP